MARPKITPEESFWQKVVRPDEPEGCWLWSGYHNAGGYARIVASGRDMPASRFAWQLANNQPWPEGMMACHSCDNRGCVRPDHIWPGTAKDNAQDMIAKGRQPKKHTSRPRHCPNCGYQIRGGEKRAERPKRKPVRSGTCKNGHPLTPENSYWHSGTLFCRECRREAVIAYRARKAAA